MPANYGDPGTPVGGWGIAALWLDTYVPPTNSNQTATSKTQWLLDIERSKAAMQRSLARQGYEWIITQYPIGTVTLGAGMEQRSFELIDIGGVINTLLTSLDESSLKFGSFGYKCQFQATNPFHVIPFITEQEAAETITATEASTESILTTIQTSLGSKNRNVQLLPIVRASMAPDGSYIANVSADFAKFANRIVKEIEFDNMRNIVRHDYHIGCCVVTQTAGTFTYYRTYEMEKYVVPKKIKGIV